MLPTGIYSSIMQGLAGNLSDNKKSSLWGQFLTTNGLPTTPPETDTTEAEFVTFLINQANIQGSALSPQEIQKRQSLATVMQIIIQIIKTVQLTDAAQNALLSFYAQYQQQYNLMAAQTPIDIGADAAVVNVSSNPSQFTLGYNNISLTDIATYLTSPTAASSFSTTTPITNFYMPTSGNNGTMNWTITFSKPDANGNATAQLYLNPVSGFASTTPILAGSHSISINPSATAAEQATSYANQIDAFMMQYTLPPTMQVKVITVTSGGNNDSDLLNNHSLVTAQGTPINIYSPLGGIISIPTTNTYVIPLPLPDYSAVGGLSTGMINALNAAPTQTIKTPPTAQFAPKWSFYPSGPGTPWSETSYTNLSIPWRFTTENIPGQYNDGSGTSDEYDSFVKTNAVVSQRASENQQLQQFIESTKSYIDSLQNTSEGENNNIQSSNSTLKSEDSIISSTLKTLKAILTGIFG